jgi:hypothetical protein
MTESGSQQYPLPVQVNKPATATAAAAETAVCTDIVQIAPTSGPGPADAPSITKEQLKDHLRYWVRIENEISTLSAEIKKRKLIHQQLSASLLKVMKQNEIDCFDIANGRIVYSKTKSRAPLNNGQLKSALTTYYKDDKDKVDSLTEFLLASRVEKTRETIKMKVPKIK